MPPKKRTKSQSEDEEELSIQVEHGKSSRKQKDAKGVQKYFCFCGRDYSSIAATFTHIKIKHYDQEKFYKSKIIDPKKAEKPATVSIRIKDIKCNQIQSELMCVADISLKEICDYYYPNKDKNTKYDILIDIDADLSDDSDSENQGLDFEGVIVPDSKRRIQINNQVYRLSEKYKFERIIEDHRHDQELKSFTQEKFKLNLVTELSKFFKPKFAAKIEFTLYLVHISEMTIQKSLKQHIKTILDEIWRNHPKIKAQMSKYYQKWNRIRYNFASSIRQQKRQERNSK